MTRPHRIIAIILCLFAPAVVHSQTPAISSLQPASIASGSGSFELTVTGSNFTQYQAHILWNGTKLNQTWKSGSQIIAWISASQVASPGTVQVQVIDTAKGTASNVADFVITGTTSPVLSVSPQALTFSATQGGPNPAPVSANVKNTGTGTVNFTDASDSSWLSVNPLSATAPQSLQISATLGTLTAGTYTGHITVTSSGAQGSPATITVTFNVGNDPLSITTTSLPNGTEGSPYSAQLQASGGKPPYSWMITGGALPGGLSMSSSGAISGTPTASGTYGFMARASDSGGATPASSNLSIQVQPIGSSNTNHYLYAFPPGHVYVYDMDNNFVQIKDVTLPNTANIGNANVRGAVASASAGMLYISYDPSGICCGHGHLIKYNLLTDTVVWDVSYSSENIGADSHSISPDGQTIYMPSGESQGGGNWYVLNASNGSVERTIDSGGSGPHNTWLNATGTHVYMDPRYSCCLVEANAATGAIIKTFAANTSNTVRPFTIDPSETYAFVTPSGAVSFDVFSVATGAKLFTVVPPGYSYSGSFNSASGVAHGIALSLDNKSLYLIDYPHNHVHVFDVTGLPSSAPKDTADIPLKCTMGAEGWLERSLDGRFVSVGDCGDVIDTTTNTIVGNAPALLKTRIFQEVDFQKGTPSASPLNRNY